jgi:hypothetical protein
VYCRSEAENRRVTRPFGLLLVVSLLAGAGPAGSEPLVDLRATAPARFQLFPAPPAVSQQTTFIDLDGLSSESLVRLAGDSDSVFTLGGPAPSGQPRLRLAVEVNEALLKVLAPDPAVSPTDLRGRIGGDWKPIDAAGRPYQLRLGARLIW